MIGGDRKRFVIKHFGEGLNTKSGYAKPQSASDISNFVVNSDGALEVRAGFSLYTELTNIPIYGCQMFELDNHEIILVRAGAGSNWVCLYIDGVLQDTTTVGLAMLQTDWIGTPIFLTNTGIYYVYQDGENGDIYRLGFNEPASTGISSSLGAHDQILKPEYWYRYYIIYLRESNVYTESSAYYFDIHANHPSGNNAPALTIPTISDSQVEFIKIYRTKGIKVIEGFNESYTAEEASAGLQSQTAYGIRGFAYDDNDEPWPTDITQRTDKFPNADRDEWVIQDYLNDVVDDEPYTYHYLEADTFDPIARGETAKDADSYALDQMLSDSGTTLAVYRDRIFYNPENREKIQYSAFQDGDPIYPRFIPTDVLTVGGSDKIVRLLTANNNLLIFKEHSIWMLTGDDVYSYNLEEITSSHGLVSKDAVCEIGNTIYFVSQEGLCTFSGYQVQLIAPQVSDVLREAALNRTSLIGTARWLYLSFCSYGAATNNKILVYDIEQNYYTIYDDMYVSQFTQLGETIYFGSNNEAAIYKIDPDSGTYTDPDDNITASWTSQKLDMGTNEPKVFSGLQFNTQTNCTIKIWVWIDNVLIHDSLTLNITSTASMDQYQGIFGVGNEIQVKFSVTQIDEDTPICIEGLSILYKGR